MCKAVLDGDAFAKRLAAFGGALPPTQLDEHRLVGVDGDRATAAGRGAGTQSSRSADIAGGGVEARLVTVDLGLDVLGAPHDAAREVDGEGVLREALAVARHPRFGEQTLAAVEDVARPIAREIATVDVQLHDLAEALDVRAQLLCGLVLGLVGRAHGRGEDHRAVQVAHDVPLVAADDLALRLAPVAHVAVRNRDATVLRHAALDAHPAALRVRLEVLRHDLLEHIERLLHLRLADLVRDRLRDPLAKPPHLTDHAHQRRALLRRVIPVDIQCGLQARPTEQRQPRRRVHVIDLSAPHLRRELHDDLHRMPDQIERVLHAPRAPQR